MRHNLSLLVSKCWEVRLATLGRLAPPSPSSLWIRPWNSDSVTRVCFYVTFLKIVKDLKTRDHTWRDRDLLSKTETWTFETETPNFGLETKPFSRDLTSLYIMVVNSRIIIEHFKKIRGYLDLVTVHCVQYWTRGTGNDLNPIPPSFHFPLEKST